MIKAVSVQTAMIDDMSSACHDLKEQLGSKLALLSNSVGIVQCDPEFIEMGIMEQLYDMLGFPLVGGTTVSIATNEAIGNHMFSILVLTSDDVEFAVSHTTGLVGDYAGSIERSMKDSLKASKKPLRMALVFPTVTDNEDLPGDIYVEAVISVCGNVPVFGTLSVNDAIEIFERSMSVCNGEVFRHEMTYVLIFGNVCPRFFVATVPTQSKMIDSDATITQADGHIISEINNVIAVRYFESIGFAINGKLAAGVYFVPLLVSARDEHGFSRTFVRAIVGFNADGHAICRGKVPIGANITFGSLQGVDILQATSEIVTRINHEQDINAVLIFSCIIRQLCVGSDALRELAIVMDSLSDGIPFVASYSGGEISPICYDDQESAFMLTEATRNTDKSNYYNSFHNYSLIACLL